MRVGILTLPLWHNYGGILQAYALSQTVAALGHEAVFLDVHRPEMGKIRLYTRRLKRTLRRLIRGSIKSPWYPDQRELVAISQNTRSFVEHRFVRKTIHISIDKLSEIAENFDAIIVGSDQVWRREYMPDVETYFLEFGNNRIRKISYAASLGVNDWLFDRAETELISSLLAKFNAISVREHSAVSILKQQVGVDAVRVCDPTLLLNSDQYRLLSDAPPNEGEEISRIFTYILDSESAPEGMLASLVEEIGGEVLDIMPRLFGPGFQKDPVDYVYPPIEAWLNAFNECKFVITDSFHGCVFSLIFNRPFIAIANVERGKTRFESLLERYGLTDRLFSSLNDVDVKTLPPVDWVHVNKIRTEEQQDSLAFLRAALLDK